MVNVSEADFVAFFTLADCVTLGVAEFEINCDCDTVPVDDDECFEVLEELVVWLTETDDDEDGDTALLLEPDTECRLERDALFVCRTDGLEETVAESVRVLTTVIVSRVVKVADELIFGERLAEVDREPIDVLVELAETLVIDVDVLDATDVFESVDLGVELGVEDFEPLGVPVAVPDRVANDLVAFGDTLLEAVSELLPLVVGEPEDMRDRRDMCEVEGHEVELALDLEVGDGPASCEPAALAVAVREDVRDASMLAVSRIDTEPVAVDDLQIVCVGDGRADVVILMFDGETVLVIDGERDPTGEAVLVLDASVDGDSDPEGVGVRDGLLE